MQDLGPAQQQEPDEDVKVAEDNERRWRSRAAVVLLDELISLEFPYSVGVLLNLLEREAARQTQKEERVERLREQGCTRGGGGDFKDGETHSLEDSYEQVQQQYVGEEQVDAEQDDGEPLGEGWCLVFIEHRTLGLQTIRAVHGAGVDVKRSIFAGKTQ